MKLKVSSFIKVLYNELLSGFFFMALPLSHGRVVSLEEVLNYEEGISFILGSSRSGKSTFLSVLIRGFPDSKKVFLIDTSSAAYANQLGALDCATVLHGIHNFSTEVLQTLPRGSALIVDDFQLFMKVSQWGWVVNYCAHHFGLSIFLAVHSHLHTQGLYFSITNSVNIYLTFSNNSRSFLKTFHSKKYLSFFNKYWLEGLQNHHIFFINSHFNVAFNFVDKLLFKSTTSIDVCEMGDDSSNLLGVTNKYWKIFSLDHQPQATETDSQGEDPLSYSLEEFYRKELQDLYPSKPHFSKTFKIIKIVLSNKVLNRNEMILDKCHWTDFLAFTQRPTFLKKKEDSSREASSDPSDEAPRNSGLGTLGFSYSGLRRKKKKSRDNQVNKLKGLCESLKQRKVFIPQALLRNPDAKKYLLFT